MSPAGKELPKPVDGSPLQDLQQAIPAGAGGIRLELFRENYANGISHRLQGWCAAADVFSLPTDDAARGLPRQHELACLGQIASPRRCLSNQPNPALACRGPGDWPDVLLLGSAEWHLFTQKNLTLYAAEMARLLATLKEQVCLPAPCRCRRQWQEAWGLTSPRGASPHRNLPVPTHPQLPPSTYLVWLSPPPRDARKVKKLELPAEWIPLYDRVAQVGWSGTYLVGCRNAVVQCPPRLHTVCCRRHRQDLGFYRPHGPAFHLDLFHIGLGAPLPMLA